MDLQAAVNDLDLSHVQNDLQTRAGIEAPAAVTAVDLYRKFLYLRLKHNERLVPPKLVDAAWHEHITETERYVADCKNLCGEYIHHTSKISEAQKQAGWERTKQLFANEFGIDLTQGTVEGVQVAGECN